MIAHVLKGMKNHLLYDYGVSLFQILLKFSKYGMFIMSRIKTWKWRVKGNAEERNFAKIYLQAQFFLLNKWLQNIFPVK